MNNKKLGTAFEREFCKIVSQYGWWVHRFQDNQNGQPCDVIMAKNNSSTLVDCKVCENNQFVLSRMEENQINTMVKWLKTGNNASYFALRMKDGEVYMMPFKTLQELKSLGYKCITYTEIDFWGTKLERFLKEECTVEDND